MKSVEKKQIITIAGRPGAGKSTTAEAVAAKLGYQRFSSGGLFRQLAVERDIDVLEASLTAEQNSELDYLVDKRLQKVYASGDKLVIDSHMAWYFMPQSFRVFLSLDLGVAAKRILAKADESRLASEHIPQDPSEYAMLLKSRLDSEKRRYKQLYNANPYDESNYDLVIDTTKHNIDQTAELIVDGYHKWLG